MSALETISAQLVRQRPQCCCSPGIDRRHGHLLPAYVLQRIEVGSSVLVLNVISSAVRLALSNQPNLAEIGLNKKLAAHLVICPGRKGPFLLGQYPLD